MVSTPAVALDSAHVALDVAVAGCATSFYIGKNTICFGRILTFGIRSICSPAKVGLVVTDFNYQPGS